MHISSSSPVHYGALESAAPLMAVPDQQHQHHRKKNVLVLVGLFVVGVAFGCVMTNWVSTDQTKTMAAIQQQLSALTELQNSMQLNSNLKKKDRKLERKLPHKYSVEHVTPLKTQDHRGTCWDFGSVAVLEQTYRAQGIKHGWLKKNEYVALSEQAYGKEVLRLCSGPPGSPQQKTCLLPGNSIWQNSTEGGDASVLYYLVNGLKNSIFADSICPYQPSEGNDSKCDGMTDEKRETNPLLFTLNKMEVYYDDVLAKTKLFEHKKAMTFTTAIPYITHYYPCIGDIAKTHADQCNPSSNQCILCPPELSMSTCCVPIRGGNNYNMNGEFIAHRGMTLEGGHVMTLVGYNDAYRTKDGKTGGFILKNSWFDGIRPPLGPAKARGSHSMKYWLQEISDWEERIMCPNSHSPYNWYQCGNADLVSKANGGSEIQLPFDRHRAFREGIESCLSNETKLYAKTNIQPLHLKCIDDFYCKSEPEMTYFVRNMTEWGDRMTKMCIFEYNTTDISKSSEYCLPPLLVSDVAFILTPIDAEVKQNDPDRCGFYFFPYEVNREYVSHFEGFYVNNFDIKWHPQSYAANQKQYPKLDYSNILKSTRNQSEYKFNGPFPFAQVVSSWKN